MKTLSVLASVLFYSVCSSTLLVINKLAVHNVPAPSLVISAQLAATVVIVFLCKILNIFTVDDIVSSKFWPWFKLSWLFGACLYSNAKALEQANVDTVIVFRSCTPIAVAFLDYLWRGTPLPNWKSFCCLIVLALGATVYVAMDEGLSLHVYTWVIIYFVLIVADMVYAKHVVDAIPMTTWGRVYYNNLLSLLPTAFFGVMFNEHHALVSHEWNYDQIFYLVLSMFVGVAMSYAGFGLRAMVSATAFTMVGVMCKFVTILINVSIWDKHANPTGITALLVCIACGAMYGHFSSESPKKVEHKKKH